MQDLEEFYQDRIWTGLDKYRPPQDLDPGLVTQADNLYNVGGSLYIRPGKQAQLATAMGAAVYVVGTFLDTSGVTWILFVSGSKLYKLQNGANTATEIELNTGTPGSPNLSHLMLNGPTVQGVRFGSSFYLIDGTTNGLYRTDLTYAYATTGLKEPTQAPSVAGVTAGSFSGFFPSSASYDAPPTYGTAFAAAVATITGLTSPNHGIAGLNFIHGGAYPAGSTVTAKIVDTTGKFAVLTVGMNAAGTAVASVGVSTAGSNYSANAVVAFSVLSGSMNAFPNSSIATPATSTTSLCNWTGYIPNGGPQNTNIWSAHDMSVFGAGPGVGGGMQQLLHPAPKALYNVDANGNAIAWASFGPVGATLAVANSIGNIPHGDNSSEWASQFVVGFYYFQPNINSAITVTVTASTVLGVISPKTLTFYPNQLTPSTVTAYPAGSLLFDFSELQTTTDSIYKWDVEFASDSQTGADLGDEMGLCIAYITGGPTWGYLRRTSGNYDTGSYTTQRYQQGTTAGGWTADSQTDTQIGVPPFNNLTKDARLTVNFGNGAAGSITFSGTSPNLSVASVTIPTTSQGSGYPQNTVVQFVDPNNTGSGATGTPVMTLDSSGKTYSITGVTVLTGGSNYSNQTEVVFGIPFNTVEFVSVPLRGFEIGGSVQFSFAADAIEMRLLPAGNTQYVSLPLTIDPSGTFASGDVTALLPSDIACVSSAQIHFLDNPVTSGNPFNFNIGAITLAGNLSVGFAAYTYLYTEVDSNGDPSLVLIIQSDPSPASNAFTATGDAAAAQIALPSSSLLNSGIADRFYLYRAGGTAPNGGEYTLVASARWTSTFAMGAQTSADAVPGTQVATSLPNYSNPYVSWGDPNGPTPPANTTYFVDNTPDAILADNPTLIVGRQPAPLAPQAIARFQNRLWLATGGNIISSWLLDASGDAGLYFNPTIDPTDPNAPIKGSGNIVVGAGDNDPVVALKALGTVLTVWKGLSCYYIDGYDPTNFGCNEYQALQDQGLVAPRAIAAADNVIYLLSQDGVYTFDGSQLNKISDTISAYLTPVLNENGGAISASAYASCAMVYHGGRLYLFAPDVNGLFEQNPNALSNYMAHVWDTRFPAWVGRWTGMNITSGVSIGTNTDDPDIWMGGLDGQLYRFTDNGDTTSAGGIGSVVIGNPGSSYSTAPTVHFANGGGSGATATANLGTGQTAGQVVSITINSAGTGYTSRPNITFTGGSGSGATATAILDVNPVPFTLATRAFGRPPRGFRSGCRGATTCRWESRTGPGSRSLGRPG